MAGSLAKRQIAKNLSLIGISVLYLPLDSIVLLLSLVWVKLRVTFGRQEALYPRHDHRKYTILVTGVGMTKGLAIARAFFQQGHKVIGADFEPEGSLACGRFSRSLAKFFPLQKPSQQKGSIAYIEGLLEIITKEKVDLWVSCSGVASAVEDGEAKEIVETRTRCKAIQFNVATTQILHEKNTFIEHTRKIGLNVPETYNITSKAQVEEALADAPEGRKYIMKTVGVVDAMRADMSLLPKSTPRETSRHIAGLPISDQVPWILQQYIDGPEYCTHAIIVKGKVRAFVACPSAELLMHYEALSSQSPLARAMLNFTENYATAFGNSFTGHLSFDFMVEKDADEEQEPIELYPIECNPRAHTAVALFNGTPEMIDAYLCYIDDRPLNSIVVPRKKDKYYWIGHDLLTELIIPTLHLISLQSSFVDVAKGYKSFIEHVLLWKDGTFEIWDPMPWWWLYHVYWPMKFWTSMSSGRAWSRLNVSTTKVFEC